MSAMNPGRCSSGTHDGRICRNKADFEITWRHEAAKYEVCSFHYHHRTLHANTRVESVKDLRQPKRKAHYFPLGESHSLCGAISREGTERITIENGDENNCKHCERVLSVVKS
jgi:hypothetical protein